MNDHFLVTSKALAGYLTAKSGRELVFSFVVNNAPDRQGGPNQGNRQSAGRTCARSSSKLTRADLRVGAPLFRAVLVSEASGSEWPNSHFYSQATRSGTSIFASRGSVVATCSAERFDRARRNLSRLVSTRVENRSRTGPKLNNGMRCRQPQTVQASGSTAGQSLSGG